jgi:CheY-like chemotaxis protein
MAPNLEDQDIRRVRCLIVDDSPFFLRAASRLLEDDGITVIAVAKHSAQALELITELRPDVALIDFSLGDECGLDLIAELADSALADGLVMICISTYTTEDLSDLVTRSDVPFLSKNELSGTAIRGIIRDDGHREHSYR